MPLDVQLVFGTPHRPITSQRFTSSDRRLSLAMMTYLSSFVRTGWDDTLLRLLPLLVNVINLKTRLLSPLQ